jgi:hypothetical protein
MAPCAKYSNREPYDFTAIMRPFFGLAETGGSGNRHTNNRKSIPRCAR